jgi:opacity protein-like surface antigen
MTWPLLLGVLLTLLVVLPGVASAEWFADVYAGTGFTESEDHDNRAPAFDLDVTVSDIAYNDGALVGGRAGYWFESLPWLGLGVDVSHLFGPDISVQTTSFRACVPAGCSTGPQTVRRADLDVTSVGFDVLLRLSLLRSQEFPKGRLQPYLSAGPAIFAAQFDDTSNFAPANQSDSDTVVGVKAAAGLAWQFHEHLALFGEYRFTHFEPEFDFRTTPLGRLEVNAPITTHYLVGGISFRFP